MFVLLLRQFWVPSFWSTMRTINDFLTWCVFNLIVIDQMIKAKINKFYYKSLAPTPYSSLWLWQRSQLRKKNIKSFCFDHTQPSSDEEPLVNQAKKVSKIMVNHANQIYSIINFFRLVKRKMMIHLTCLNLMHPNRSTLVY